MRGRLLPATAAVLLVLPLGAAVASSASFGRISDAEAMRAGDATVRALGAWHAEHGTYARASLDQLGLGDATGVALVRLGMDGYRVDSHATSGRTFRATLHPSS